MISSLATRAGDGNAPRSRDRWWWTFDDAYRVLPLRRGALSSRCTDHGTHDVRLLTLREAERRDGKVPEKSLTVLKGEDLLTLLRRYPCAQPRAPGGSRVLTAGRNGRDPALHTLSKIKVAGAWPAITRSLLHDPDDEVARCAWVEPVVRKAIVSEVAVVRAHANDAERLLRDPNSGFDPDIQEAKRVFVFGKDG